MDNDLRKRQGIILFCISHPSLPQACFVCSRPFPTSRHPLFLSLCSDHHLSLLDFIIPCRLSSISTTSILYSMLGIMSESKPVFGQIRASFACRGPYAYSCFAVLFRNTVFLRAPNDFGTTASQPCALERSTFTTAALTPARTHGSTRKSPENALPDVGRCRALVSSNMRRRGAMLVSRMSSVKRREGSVKFRRRMKSGDG